MNLFVYGTLMFPEVFTAVTGVEARGVRASLPGFARRAVLGEAYPAIAPRFGAQVPGVCYQQLPAHLLSALDAYEGPEYLRERQRVQCAGSVPRVAWCYVFPARLRPRLALHDWDEAAFARNHLRGYLQRL